MSTRTTGSTSTLGEVIAAMTGAELPGLAGAESLGIGRRAEADLRTAGWRINHRADTRAPDPPGAVTAVIAARLRGDVPGLTDTEARTTARHAIAIATAQGWHIVSARPQATHPARRPRQR
ncbi:hypothetical protein ABVG11_34350 [Streptomyces sp. HD1123-B1]|uniref:hypothetical protein n=1 Tax=Streptomyces huangiella TaxID=3228804 RepID=UPI003D7C7C3A